MKDKKLTKTSKVAMLELYDALERRLKRYRPRDYITWMSKQLAASWLEPQKFVKIPPHRLMHSIEANCSFWKEGYEDPVDWNAVAKVMNTYNDCIDPFQLSTIHENLDRFFLMMWREQIELQKRVSWSYIIRVWHLFVRSASMQESNKEFLTKYRLTMDNWIKFSFLCWAFATQESGNPFLIVGIPNESVGLDHNAFNSFLEHSARTPSEIGNQFQQIRKEFPYELHSLIRSAFLETPIIIFSDGTMIVPHTHLLFRHSGEGLYRLSKDLDAFNDEFGYSFEEYVKNVLDSVRDSIRIISNKQLEKASRAKSCDFLFEMKDTVVLVECKACSFTARHFSDNAIRTNNSTGKVAKALAQLYASAKDLEEGVFDQYDVDKMKSTIGIVVTFGEIPSANKEWYFEEFFLKRADRKLDETTYPSRQMTRRPIVIDISTLEELVAFLNFHSKGLVELYDEKELQGYAATGDWSIWLNSQLDDKNGKGNELLSFLKKDRVAFINELGLPHDLFPEVND